MYTFSIGCNIVVSNKFYGVGLLYLESQYATSHLERIEEDGWLLKSIENKLSIFEGIMLLIAG